MSKYYWNYFLIYLLHFVGLKFLISRKIMLVSLAFFFFFWCLQEASSSQVASAATLSVAFMEALSTFFQSFSHGYKWVHSRIFGCWKELKTIIYIIISLWFMGTYTISRVQPGHSSFLCKKTDRQFIMYNIIVIIEPLQASKHKKIINKNKSLLLLEAFKLVVNCMFSKPLLCFVIRMTKLSCYLFLAHYCCALLSYILFHSVV